MESSAARVQIVLRACGPAIALVAVLLMDSQAVSDNKLKSSGFDVHELIVHETAEAFRNGRCGEHAVVTTQPAGVLAEFPPSATSSAPTASAGLGTAAGAPAAASAEFESGVIHTPFPLNEVVPSWNVEVPPDTGFLVQLRMGLSGEDRWTPYYYLGVWGACTPPAEKITSDEFGRIDIDYFMSRRLFDRIQYRVRLFGRPGRPGPRLRRFAVVCTNSLGDKGLYSRTRRTIELPPKTRWQRRLPVPYRSQTVEDDSIRHSICSPTSVAMVMAYRGVERPTRHMCDMIWDAEYGLYGNWARAVQGAFVEGVPGYVMRFGTWDEVKAAIARDQPVIASIRVPHGALTGAPYKASAGHLLVIAGFDEDGNVLVNDPAAKTKEAGLAAYKADEMQKVWLDAGGVGYILLPPAP